MELIENSSNNLHLALKELIDRKSKRDRKNFTIYQLAKAIDMPHSMLVKLIHVDFNKRVNNPRIDTLTRIINFFKQDGFEITIDDLLTGFKAVATNIDISEQDIGIFTMVKAIPIYSMRSGLEKSIGIVDVNLTEGSNCSIALLSEEDIKPMFKKGSIFIVDTDLKPEHDMLVAGQVKNNNKIFIRKFYVIGNKKILKSYDDNVPLIDLTRINDYQIIGVVVQVNAKT